MSVSGTVEAQNVVPGSHPDILAFASGASAYLSPVSINLPVLAPSPASSAPPESRSPNSKTSLASAYNAERQRAELVRACSGALRFYNAA